MFEKEAENYVNEEYNFSYYPKDNLSTRTNAEHDRQKGAEFGYHQANDWHNQTVDDKSLNTAVGNCDESCNGEVSVNLVFDHDDEKYYIDDTVYWKEVTLPEETKKWTVTIK